MRYLVNVLNWLHHEDEMIGCSIKKDSDENILDGIVTLTHNNSNNVFITYVSNILLDIVHVLFVDEIKKYTEKVLTYFVVKHVVQQVEITLDDSLETINTKIYKISENNSCYLLVHAIFFLENSVYVDYIQQGRLELNIDSLIREHIINDFLDKN